MESRGLTTITGGGQVGIFDPDAQLEMAIRAAKALSNVIAQKKKPVIINGEQYLEFEDWQTLGQFDGVSVRTGDAEFVEIDGVKGAKAKAYLINSHTGEIIGGAEAYCMRDEDKWGTRPKYEWQGEGANRKRVKVGEEVVPWFQLASMAQTRAGSKALRNKEAWIAVLGGYKPTPAEEMTANTVSSAVEEKRTIDKSDHWCELHQTNFFKKGKMKGYSHPIGDTGEWCNEHSKEQKKEQVPPDFKQAEEDIKTYWPSEETTEPVVVETQEAGKTPRPTRDPETVVKKQDLLDACTADFGMKPAEITKELTAAFPDGLPGTFGECYAKIVELRCGK